MAEHQLPKLTVGVRFPSPAPRKAAGQGACLVLQWTTDDRLHDPCQPPMTPCFPPRRSWTGHAEGLIAQVRPSSGGMTRAVTNIGHTIRRRISSGAASPVQVEAIASEHGYLPR